MARLSLVADILNAEHKEIITCFKGELVKVEKQFTAGDGVKQKLTVKDKDGDKLEVHVWDQEPIARNDEGEQITFLTTSGQRGPSGVMAFDDDYKNKVTRVLKVTKAAEIVVGVGDHDGGRNNDRREHEPSEGRGRAREEDSRREDRGRSGSGGNDRRERQPEREQRGGYEGERELQQESDRSRERVSDERDRRSRQEDGDGQARVDRRLTQLANMQCLCLDMTARYTRAWQKASKIEITADQFQKLCSSLFIAATREELDRELSDSELIYESEPDPGK